MKLKYYIAETQFIKLPILLNKIQYWLKLPKCFAWDGSTAVIDTVRIGSASHDLLFSTESIVLMDSDGNTYKDIEISWNDANRIYASFQKGLLKYIRYIGLTLFSRILYKKKPAVFILHSHKTNKPHICKDFITYSGKPFVYYEL